ncbi:alpha/beta hydrolase [Schaalia dentiphila]|uniref:alpha/beta hydrolase n=1 Tax=Schaalia dentiphila TaxID=3050224 RepID=UPI002852A60D|nr:alpha/beta hydrolase [Schaalia sp. C24]
MATWADIQSWDHNAIIEAEDLIEEKVREAREIIADLEHAANDIRSQGEAPDRMRQRLTEIQDKLDSRLNELTEYALATAELHGYVSRVVAKRKSAWEVAAEIHATISENGEAKLEMVSGEEDPSRGNKYLEMCDVIIDAIAIATEAEETVGSRYKALADGQYSMSEGRHSATAGLADDADPSWSPEEVSVWWALLSESEREALINKDPEKYGNLNGIDMASRVKANDLVLNGRIDGAGNRIPGTGLLEKAQKEYDEAKAAYENDKDSFWGRQYSDDEGLERYVNARNKLNDLLAIKKALEGEDISLVALEFGEPGENVRAALAIGDVDNAKHVTTFVPGMTTSCRRSTDLNLGYARNLIEAAENAGGAEKGSVAAVAWMGYEAPPDPSPEDVSVAFPGKAQAGAEKLNGFLTGIHSWRSERGMDVHQTPVTHSYGSLTGGFAMRDIGEGVVDDFVYTGSPGSAVRSVGTLGVDPEHTWVSAIPLHDEVQGMGLDVNFGRDPKELEGIGHLSGDATGGDGYNSDPNAEKYANHSAYFYRAKEGQHNYSLEDIGKVIADTKER